MWHAAFQWWLHFWNFRLQSPCSSTPILIVYPMALDVDHTFFEDSVQASAGGPDGTCLRTGCGPQGASLQTSHLARLHLLCFLVQAPPTPASVPLLELFPLPGMPSAIARVPKFHPCFKVQLMDHLPREASVTLDLHSPHPLSVQLLSPKSLPALC